MVTSLCGVRWRRCSSVSWTSRAGSCQPRSSDRPVRLEPRHVQEVAHHAIQRAGGRPNVIHARRFGLGDVAGLWIGQHLGGHRDDADRLPEIVGDDRRPLFLQALERLEARDVLRGASQADELARLVAHGFAVRRHPTARAVREDRLQLELERRSVLHHFFDGRSNRRGALRREELAELVRDPGAAATGRGDGCDTARATTNRSLSESPTSNCRCARAAALPRAR